MDGPQWQTSTPEAGVSPSAPCPEPSACCLSKLRAAGAALSWRQAARPPGQQLSVPGWAHPGRHQ
eukprot:2085983-Alexandrium_andersonii.AAC.1